MAKAGKWQRSPFGNKANGQISRLGYFWAPMAETLVVDSSGRVYLPKIIRRLLRLEPNSLMEISVMDDQVILRRVDSVAQKGRGMFRSAAAVPVEKALDAARRRYGVD